MENDLMPTSAYFMENAEEADRLEMKTDSESVYRQATWAGIKPGMRVLDLGCGTGKTSSFLYQLVQPGGSVVGIDRSQERIEFARRSYGRPGLDFLCLDILDETVRLDTFDFVWIRFLLQYYRKGATEIVRKAAGSLRPGGAICLVDQDCNSLIYYGLPNQFQLTIEKIIGELHDNHNFDPFVGRKLYSFLVDCSLNDIQVSIEAHNLIYGPLQKQQRYNLRKKIEVAALKTPAALETYPGELQGLLNDFDKFFEDKRRFSYSPLILCRGCKPG